MEKKDHDKPLNQALRKKGSELENAPTFTLYFAATSIIKGTMSSVGSPLSSFMPGGYHETAITPERSGRCIMIRASVETVRSIRFEALILETPSTNAKEGLPWEFLVSLLVLKYDILMRLGMYWAF